ncbi:MAG: hypothetical protein ACYC3F_05620 [Gemmatimonadaceae bacterium]
MKSTVRWPDGKSPYRYPATPFASTPGTPNVQPDYPRLLEWMQSIGGRAASLDFWARGNYARRLASLRAEGKTPVLVRARTIGEMRWAYRRLALLGTPVEFLWDGRLTPPLKVLHLHPGNDDDRWDAGWGYITTLARVAKTRRGHWCPVLGYARLMPEAVPNWIVNEVAPAFAAGDVFVTPSALVGTPPGDPHLNDAFEAVLGGLPVRSDEPASAMLQLDLPLLDRLSPRDFQSLLADNGVELDRLRFAWRRLVSGVASSSADDIISELNYEVSELALADRYSSFRARVTRLGGVVAVTSAAVGAAATATAGDVLQAVGVAAAGAAAAGLCEVLRGRSERELEVRRNPLFLLWRLGSEDGSKIFTKVPKLLPVQNRTDAPIRLGEDGYFHWLAPPEAGVSFLFVKKSEDESRRPL